MLIACVYICTRMSGLIPERAILTKTLCLPHLVERNFVLKICLNTHFNWFYIKSF